MTLPGFALLGDRALLADASATGALPLVAAGMAAPLVTAEDDWPSVRRAAGDLQADIERVSGVKPEVKSTTPAAAPVAVIIGTVGKSSLTAWWPPGSSTSPPSAVSGRHSSSK
jgi:hypothetical protein